MNTIIRNGTEYKITDAGVVSPLLEKRFEREDGKPFEAKPPEEDQVLLCMEWLRRFAKPRKTVNYARSSYGLKHCVEDWCGEYVSNGAFIEAARRLGFEVITRSSDGLNTVFRLSYDKKALERWRP